MTDFSPPAYDGIATSIAYRLISPLPDGRVSTYTETPFSCQWYQFHYVSFRPSTPHPSPTISGLLDLSWSRTSHSGWPLASWPFAPAKSNDKDRPEWQLQTAGREVLLVRDTVATDNLPRAGRALSACASRRWTATLPASQSVRALLAVRQWQPKAVVYGGIYWVLTEIFSVHTWFHTKLK